MVYTLLLPDLHCSRAQALRGGSKKEGRRETTPHHPPPHHPAGPAAGLVAACRCRTDTHSMNSICMDSRPGGLSTIHPTRVGWGWLDRFVAPRTQRPAPRETKQGGRLDNWEIRAAGFMRCASPGGSPFGESPARCWFADDAAVLLSAVAGVVVPACSLVWGWVGLAVVEMALRGGMGFHFSGIHQGQHSEQHSGLVWPQSLGLGQAQRAAFRACLAPITGAWSLGPGTGSLTGRRRLCDAMEGGLAAGSAFGSCLLALLGWACH